MLVWFQRVPTFADSVLFFLVQLKRSKLSCHVYSAVLCMLVWPSRAQCYCAGNWLLTDHGFVRGCVTEASAFCLFFCR